MNELKTLLSDKRFLAALATVIVGIAATFGLQWTEVAVSDSITQIVEGAGVIVSLVAALYAGKRVGDKTGGGE